MGNIYISCMRRLTTALTKLKWKTEFESQQSEWLKTGVARQLLRHAMLNLSDKQQLVGVEVDPKVLTPVLDSVQRLSTSVGPGRVSVIGNLNDMTILDWLNLEAVLLKERLTTGPKVTLSEQLVVDRVLPEKVSHLPAIVRKYRLLELKALAALCVTFPLSFAGFTGIWHATQSTVISELTVLLSSMTSVVVSALFMLVTEVRELIQARRAIDATSANSLSSTWDDVFALKTQTDALLVGMLADICDMALTKNPSASLPDFMALSPATALKLATRFFKENGVVYSRIHEQVSSIAALSEKSDKSAQPPQTAGPTYFGYTFAALAEPFDSSSGEEDFATQDVSGDLTPLRSPLPAKQP